MNRIVFALIFCALKGLAQDNNGFENYKFGTPPSQYQNLTLELDEGDTKLYSCSNTVINGVEFESMNITFHKNRLTSLSFRTKNSTGNKLLADLKTKYGQPKKSDPARGHYEWKNNSLELLFEKLKSSQDAAVSVYCLADKAKK